MRPILDKNRRWVLGAPLTPRIEWLLYFDNLTRPEYLAWKYEKLGDDVRRVVHCPVFGQERDLGEPEGAPVHSAVVEDASKDEEVLLEALECRVLVDHGLS